MVYLERLIPILFAIWATVKYGYLGTSFYGFQDNAVLYGNISVFAVSWGIGYVVIEKVELENLVSMSFAGLASYFYGIQVGYQYPGVHSNIGAAIYGYPTVFILGWIVGLKVVWPIVRTFTNASATVLNGVARTSRAMAFLPFQQLKASGGALALALPGGSKAVAKRPALPKIGSLVYDGQVDRDFAYDDNGRQRKERIRAPFKVERNLASLMPRDREAVRLLSLLEKEGAIDRKSADRLKFGLAYANGNGQVSGGRPFNISQKLARQISAQSIHDLVKLEAQYRGASSEAALSEILTHLETAAHARKPSAAILTAYKTIVDSNNDDEEDGGQWA